MITYIFKKFNKKFNGEIAGPLNKPPFRGGFLGALFTYKKKELRVVGSIRS
tara:strand:- start:600 stop:752 length:153 start_codon:yes stop_codon:yes gene_type:complete